MKCMMQPVQHMCSTDCLPHAEAEAFHEMSVPQHLAQQRQLNEIVEMILITQLVCTVYKFSKFALPVPKKRVSYSSYARLQLMYASS